MQIVFILSPLVMMRKSWTAVTNRSTHLFFSFILIIYTVTTHSVRRFGWTLDIKFPIYFSHCMTLPYHRCKSEGIWILLFLVLTTRTEFNNPRWAYLLWVKFTWICPSFLDIYTLHSSSVLCSMCKSFDFSPCTQCYWFRSDGPYIPYVIRRRHSSDLVCCFPQCMAYS